MRIRVAGIFAQGDDILCMKYVYGGQEVCALPGGGVNKNVAVIDALKDEWKEELGVKIEVGDILFVGEAHGDKRHPQTIHIVFEISEIFGTPKIRPDNTTSLELVWVPAKETNEKNLYPDIGNQVYNHYVNDNKRSIEFIKECMERGYF